MHRVVYQKQQMLKWSSFTILRTSLKSSPFHNQPSWTFGLLHATLQQNDCASSSFPVTLWPWGKVKAIKLESHCRISLCLASYQVWNKSVHKLSWCRLRYILQNYVSRLFSSFIYLLHKMNSTWASTKPQAVEAFYILSTLNVKFARKWAEKFHISQTSVTMNEGQGHSNWKQTVKFCGLYLDINVKETGAGIMESDSLSAVQLFSVWQLRHWKVSSGAVTVGSQAVTARPVPCAWT